MDILHEDLNERDFLAGAAGVRVVRLARCFCTPDWSWEAAGQSQWREDDGWRPMAFNFDLWTLLQGTGRLIAPDREYALSAGDCFILRGDERYRASHDPSDPLVMFAVHYDYLDASGQVVVPRHTQRYRRMANLVLLVQLFGRMEAAWSNGGPGRAQADAWLTACLAEIHPHAERPAPPDDIHSHQARRVERLCWEIRQTPQQALDLDTMAQRLNCSRGHFCRLFKEQVGVSPRQFILEARMDAAKALLLGSCYPIARVAELAGFTDVHYFSRTFKKRTGVTPCTYRDTLGNLGESPGLRDMR